MLMVEPPYTDPKMEARRSSGSYVVETPREIDELDEEARVYGSRWVEVETADGGTSFQEVPLTWEDLFDPQEDDHVSHGDEHIDVTSDTRGILKALFRARGRDDVKVCEDMKMFWADAKVAKIAPDVAVAFGVEDPERRRDSFNELEEGTRPSFVLEVTSRKTAHFDRGDKPGVYRKAKVKECLVVDRLKSPWTIQGYRLDKSERRQLKIRPDKEGRYLAETLQVYFSIGEDGKGLVLTDAVTGEVLLAPLEALDAAEQRVAEEAEAREAAERQAAEEAEGRRQEAEARAAAEARIQELQAEIERLKASGA